VRNSEEMAFALYQAWARHYKHEDMASSWDELCEDSQQAYLADVNAAFAYLFEHGRISQYINAEQLAAAEREYQAYLGEQEPSFLTIPIISDRTLLEGTIRIGNNTMIYCWRTVAMIRILTIAAIIIVPSALIAAGYLWMRALSSRSD
jgi:hypothetical protein